VRDRLDADLMRAVRRIRREADVHGAEVEKVPADLSEADSSIAAAATFASRTPLNGQLGSDETRWPIDHPSRREDRVRTQRQLRQLVDFRRDFFTEAGFQLCGQIEDFSVLVLRCQRAYVQDLRGAKGDGLVDGEVSKILPGHAVFFLEFNAGMWWLARSLVIGSLLRYL